MDAPICLTFHALFYPSVYLVDVIVRFNLWFRIKDESICRRKQTVYEKIVVNILYIYLFIYIRWR